MKASGLSRVPWGVPLHIVTASESVPPTHPHYWWLSRKAGSAPLYKTRHWCAHTVHFFQQDVMVDQLG